VKSEQPLGSAPSAERSTPLSYKRIELTEEMRLHLPGWLLKLLDSDDLYGVDYAARHCSDRLFIRLLSQRADELRGVLS
jgi:hypothetical protein